MKILVAVKRVIDYSVKVRVKADNSNVDLTNVKMSLNPFCEIAVEEALRLREAGKATEVVVVSIGVKAAQDQIRTALAMGADRGIFIETGDAELNSLSVAKLLAKVVQDEQPGLVLLGKQAIDSDNNQTGQMLAALCGYPQATTPAEMGVVIANTITLVRVEAPAERSAGIKVESVDALIDALKNKAKAI